MNRSAITVIVAVLVTGCASASNVGHSPTGVLTGGIVLAGGPSAPAGASARFAAGDVQVRRSGREIAEMHVTDNQTYRFDLPAGDYQLVVNMGSVECSAKATVSPGQTTDQNLTCQVK